MNPGATAVSVSWSRLTSYYKLLDGTQVLPIQTYTVVAIFKL